MRIRLLIGALVASFTLHVAAANLPGTATVISNPYDNASGTALTVQGATLSTDGKTITNFTSNTVIQFGNKAGSYSDFAELYFQGFSLDATSTLTIQSGADFQAVRLTNVDSNASSIAGTLQAVSVTPGLFKAPVLAFQNPRGVNVSATGKISSPSGLIVDTLQDGLMGNWSFTGDKIVNLGTIDGGSSLELSATAINGGGAFKGDAIAIHTFGNANNPGNANFLFNGLQLSPSTAGGTVTLTLNAYGISPQFINLSVNGSANLWMPPSWPTSLYYLPANNPVVMPNDVRPSGTVAPAYGGGSMIIQATRDLSFASASPYFVFPGGLAFKAGGTIDLNGVTVDQGWTTAGKSFQGVYFEAPRILNSKGSISAYTNALNWVNFSTPPLSAWGAAALTPQPDGTAKYVDVTASAPHINTYSTLVAASAAGANWVAQVNTTPLSQCTITASPLIATINSTATLAANCPGLNPAAVTFVWSPTCNPASSASTCAVTSGTTGLKAYSVTAMSGDAIVGSGSTSLNWQSPAAVTCSMGASPSTSPTVNTNATLTANCAGVPAGTTYEWTPACVPASSGSACTVTASTAGAVTYTVNARSAGTIVGSGQIQLNWQAAGGGGGGGGGADFCSAYSNVVRQSMTFGVNGGVRLLTSSIGGFQANGVIVLSFVVPTSPATYATPGDTGISEYGEPATFRQMTLSKSACDFRTPDATGANGPLAMNYGNTANIDWNVGAAPIGLVPGQTYYFNFRNYSPDLNNGAGGVSCFSGTCNAGIVTNWPQ